MYIELTEVYQATNNGLDIIHREYPDSVGCETQKNKKFKTHTEKTPSSSLLFDKEKQVYYVINYARQDEGRKYPIDIYKENYSCDFKEALNRIVGDFNLNIDGNKGIKSRKADIEARAANDDENEGDYTLFYKDSFTEFELKKLGKHIDPKHCDQLRFRSLEGYNYTYQDKKTKELKTIEIRSNERFPIFFIEAGEKDELKGKIYKPYDEKHQRFLNIDLGMDHIFGLDRAEKARIEYADIITADSWKEKNDPEKRRCNAVYDEHESDPKHRVKIKHLVICSGGSDAINIQAAGNADYGLELFPIWPNSESFKWTAKKLQELFTIAQNVYICYDIDPTGIMQANKVALENWAVKVIKLPNWLLNHKDDRGYACKDAKDFLKIKSNGSFLSLVQEAHCLRPFDVVYDKKIKDYRYPFNQLQAYSLLNALGVYRYPSLNAKRKYKFIRLKGHIVEDLGDTPINVKKIVIDFLKEREFAWHISKTKVLNMILRTPGFSESSLDGLEPFIPNFKHSTKDTRYLFFKDHVVKITKDQIEKIKGVNFDECHVWQDNVIDHSFKLLDPTFNVSWTKSKNGDYDYSVAINDKNDLWLDCLWQMSRVHWRKKDEYGLALSPKEIKEENNHFANKLYTVGYLMFGHKFDDQALVVRLQDANNIRTSKAQGGTGKSFLIKSLYYYTKLLSYDELDGRQKDLFKNSHWNENINANTDIVFIDDLHRYFPINEMYTFATNSLKINVKGVSQFSLGYDKSPKFITASNYISTDLDASTMRRSLFVGNSDFFHDNTNKEYKENRRISDYYKMQLFTDFNQEQFNLFYNSVAQCIQFYLQAPEIVKCPMGDLNEGALEKKIGTEVIDYFDDFFNVWESDASNRPYLDNLFVSNHLVHKEHSEYPIYKHSPNVRKEKLRDWCQLRGFILNPKDPQERAKLGITCYYNETGDRFQNTHAGKKNVGHWYIDTRNSPHWAALAEIKDEAATPVNEPANTTEELADDDPLNIPFEGF